MGLALDDRKDLIESASESLPENRLDKRLLALELRRLLIDFANFED
jgi:hypothetical protein